MLRAVDPIVALGRSVVVAPGSAAPVPWSSAPRLEVTSALLADRLGLEKAIDKLHRAWVAREPMVAFF